MTSSNYFNPSGFINIDCLHYNNNIPTGLKYIFKGSEHLWSETCARWEPCLLGNVRHSHF